MKLSVTCPLCGSSVDLRGAPVLPPGGMGLIMTIDPVPFADHVIGHATDVIDRPRTGATDEVATQPPTDAEPARRAPAGP